MGDTNNLYSDGDGSIHKVVAKCAFTIGDKDKTVLPYMVAENVEALKDRAKLISYTNCGHDPLIDRLDDLVKDIKEFCV